MRILGIVVLGAALGGCAFQRAEIAQDARAQHRAARRRIHRGGVAEPFYLRLVATALIAARGASGFFGGGSDARDCWTFFAICT